MLNPIFGFLLSSSMLVPALAELAPQDVLTAPHEVRVGIISGEAKTDFDAKIASFFKNQWSQCGNCVLENLTPYTPEGQFDQSAVEQSIKNAKMRIKIFFFNTNWKVSTKSQSNLVDLARQLVKEGNIVVGTAGLPKEGEVSAPLSRTFIGQIPGAVILGEINERERLMATSFFGPEMLTAVKPPRDLIGKGLGPSYFVARFAPNFSRRLPQDWIKFFQEKKDKNRKIWLAVDDLFPR